MKSNPNALYHGGIDGGYYFEVLEKKGSEFRIKIFLDYNEELLIDAYFAGTDENCSKQLSVENIHHYISTYNDDKIFINDPHENEFCKLVITQIIYKL